MTEPHGPPGQLQALPRNLTPAEHQLVDASNAFSFALWYKVSGAEPDSNVFISPLSASFALGMTLDGAANATFDQMRQALQLDGLSQDDINAGYRSLIALLTSLDPSVTMRIANSIWYRQDFPFSRSFLNDAQSFFDADVRGLDFGDVTGSLDAINGWVDQKTNGKIPAILDGIDPTDVMFLINALYFNGSWRSRFDSTLTTNDRFATAGGITQPVHLMHRQAEMLYAETAAYQAVDLPYGNGAFTMTVILPKPDVSVETLSASLNAPAWRSLASSLATSEVDLALPKFSMSFDRKLNGDLEALGMLDPFDVTRADFTRMSPAGKSLYISLVKQKAFVKVDEQGTEAAAATSVGITATSLPVPRIMRVDRPFVFIIRERLSGTILFMGKVNQIPTA